MLTRLFFALLPDSATREHLRAAAVLELPQRARAVAPENFHITLAFVGEIPNADLLAFREMGARLCLRRCAIALDSFEYWRKSQAMVLAAQNNPPELAEAADALRLAVAVRVPPRRDDKPWRAHVTLARKVAQAPVLKAMLPITWTSDSFCLMSSKIGGNGSVYTVVESWSLLDKP